MFITSSMRIIIRIFRWKHNIFFLFLFFTCLLVLDYATLYEIHIFKQPTSFRHVIRSRKMEQDHFVRSGYDVSYTQSPNTKPIYILLMTYMRGGSSFLGEMFNQNPKVFYWFEPLAETFKKIMGMIDSRNWFLHDDLSLRWDFVSVCVCARARADTRACVYVRARS